jgi:DNA-binding NarL/FixJ family response regulator
VLHIAVVDPLPLFRQGAAAVLSAAGHRVETPDDALAWSQSRRHAVVLLTLAERPDWTLLTRMHNESSVAVVAMLQDLHPGGVRAVHLGARSVLPRACDAVTLVRTVEATASGQSVLPADVLDSVVGEGHSGLRVSEQQMGWLTLLAAGSTVAEVAAQAGYSERAMFRILKQLYQEIGVEGRMQAVLRAQELGWIPTSIRSP